MTENAQPPYDPSLLIQELELAEKLLYRLSVAGMARPTTAAVVGAPDSVEPGQAVRLTTALEPGAILDARKPFYGHNWFHGEGDGRWAGRSTLSTLVLAKIPAGLYEFEFTFVRFVDRELPAKMLIAFNGIPLALTLRAQSEESPVEGRERAPCSPSNPYHFTARLEIKERPGDLADVVTFQFPFTKQPNPKDKRQLTARLRTVALRLLSK